MTCHSRLGAIATPKHQYMIQLIFAVEGQYQRRQQTLVVLLRFGRIFGVVRYSVHTSDRVGYHLDFSCILGFKAHLRTGLR